MGGRRVAERAKEEQQTAEFVVDGLQVISIQRLDHKDVPSADADQGSGLVFPVFELAFFVFAQGNAQRMRDRQAKGPGRIQSEHAEWAAVNHSLQPVTG
jgi:hypothetical protein